MVSVIRLSRATWFGRVASLSWERRSPIDSAAGVTQQTVAMGLSGMPPKGGGRSRLEPSPSAQRPFFPAARPKIIPTSAVAVMARAPQSVTLAAPRAGPAPPAEAPRRAENRQGEERRCRDRNRDLRRRRQKCDDRGTIAPTVKVEGEHDRGLYGMRRRPLLQAPQSARRTSRSAPWSRLRRGWPPVG